MLWNIRKTIKKGDYLYALVPEHPKATKNGYVLEHRVVVENHLGRQLYENEVVHHIDGNKHNNAIENLQALDRMEHAHLKRYEFGHTFEVSCANCDKIFQKEYRHRKDSGVYFCSRSCNAKYYYKLGRLSLRKPDMEHGINMYRKGCRCDVCKLSNTEKVRRYRLKNNAIDK